MSEASSTQTVSGWGRMNPAECAVFRPEKVRALRGLLERGGQPTYIARGLGRSYGDTAVNGGAGIIDFTRLNRMIAFDPATGVLHCEAGVSLAEIIETFLPRGYFPGVVPGTKFVTVGGAIANDIHGKNHHREGTFCQFVDEVDLLLANGEVMTCGPNTNADVFWATAGGIGLTGIILSAKLRLARVESSYISVDYHRTKNLDGTLAAMAASDEHYQYSVCWIDCIAGGASLGRSVLLQGNPARRDQLRGPQAENPLALHKGVAKPIPFDFPDFVLNPLGMKAFNTLLYNVQYERTASIVSYEPYFFPLDMIHHWNRMYGKRGFAQYQATIPKDQARGVQRILERISSSRRASFLAVLKTFGAQNPGLLSYPNEGYTLALDLPNRDGLVPLLNELDRVVLDHGGRLYTAKDVATSADAFAQMYPRLDEFRAIKARLDPYGRFSSSMARRLGVAGG